MRVKAHPTHRMGLSIEGRYNEMGLENWRAGVWRMVLIGAVLWSTTPVFAQHGDEEHNPIHETMASGHASHAGSPGAPAWEGSAEGIAYSEFNHHLAGVLVLLMGLAELAQASRLPSLGWLKVLLHLSMLIAGLFLLIWSDHEAWPIGSLSFSQTYFGEDHEILQHKTFGVLLLVVGTVELLRRYGRLTHFVWTVPLPLLATVAGAMLFGHSHGLHPSAQKIAVHHAMMGTVALVAGSSKFLSGWFHPSSRSPHVTWEWIWGGLVFGLGILLLWYSE